MNWLQVLASRYVCKYQLLKIRNDLIASFSINIFVELISVIKDKKWLDCKF